MGEIEKKDPDVGFYTLPGFIFYPIIFVSLSFSSFLFNFSHLLQSESTVVLEMLKTVFKHFTYTSQAYGTEKERARQTEVPPQGTYLPHYYAAIY